MLEVELQGKLHQARLPCLQHLPEGSVAEVSVRIVELRLVKDVKNVGAELEVARFRNCNSLGHRQVPLILSGTTADRTRCRRELSERRISKLARVKIEM